MLKKPDEENNLLDVPDNIEDFFKLVEKEGRFSLAAPGQTKTGDPYIIDPSEYWTLYFQGDYD